MSMNGERILVTPDEVGLQRKLDKMQMASWVQELARWDVIAHLTFCWEVSLWSARRAYERFMRKEYPHLSYFYAEEENPGRPGYHVHALWAECRELYRKEAWSRWYGTYGRARIEPVKRRRDVSGYCAKYVTKERAWWDCRIQWHRLSDSRPFRLEADSSFLSPARGQLHQVEVQPAALPVPQPEFGFTPEVFNLYSERPGEGPSIWKEVEPGLWENTTSTTVEHRPLQL